MISSEETEEATSRCMDADLTHSFEVVLKDLPEVLMYIKRLNEHIQKQQQTLVKLFGKLKEYKHLSRSSKRDGNEVKNASTQTEPWLGVSNVIKTAASQDRDQNVDEKCSKWSAASGIATGRSLADEVKKVAESAMQQTGFVYEETSGMYYDYNTGYYYNAEMGLYYDGHSGTYLYYNEGTKSYEYHSQAATAMPSSQLTSSEVICEDILSESDSSSAEGLIDTVADVKTKSIIIPVEKPDPLEAKENDLNTPGSNPMAPVLPEPSSLSSRKESRHGKKSSHDSKHDHKRKGKHKKHKSKKKKKKRRHSPSKDEISLEEGECSDSSDSEVDRENGNCLQKNELIKCEEEMHQDELEKCEEKMAVEETPAAIETCEKLSPSLKVAQPLTANRRISEEVSEAWPPCMRIIVQSTEVRNLRVGTLFIVTCKGGTLGREKFHAVTIPDINISKHHGIFTFDESNEGKYFFTDYGSRNGTYVNKQRLSSAKQESEPCEISHGTVITLGSTELLCHIHPGRETCEECEPGVVAAKKAEDFELQHPTSNKGKSKSETRLQELRRLRKRFGLESNESKGDLLAPGYEDRAEIRRVTVGSLNEHAKTEAASTTESIRSTNKGFKMLSKMGWKEGESLGKDGTGLTEPVLVSRRADKAGLGADNSYSAAPVDMKSKLRADNWSRARQRYVQLADTAAGAEDAEDGDD